MKKIILSLVLVSSVFFLGNVSAQYEIVDYKIMEELGEDSFNNIEYNNYIGSFQSDDKSNYGDFKNDLLKFNITKEKCKFVSNFYKSKDGKKLYVACGVVISKNYTYPTWSIYINGKKIKTKDYDFNGPGVASIKFKDDKLFIDFVTSFFVGAGYVYTLEDISTKEELLNINFKIKSSLGKKYKKIFRKIDLFISRLDNKKLNNLKLKIVKLKDKYKNDTIILKLLDYIENLVKIKTGDYIYEYNFDENNFKLGIKNDKEYNKILFGETGDKNVYSINGESFNGGKWEQNTHLKAGKTTYKVRYYDKNGNLYYIQEIYID